MLSIRHATGLDDSARQRAAAIAQAIALHPLVPHLTGTVIIGAGGTGTLRMDDARPRVLVALAGPRDSTPLARANAARCDALVIGEIGVATPVQRAARGPVLKVARPDQEPPPFLGTTGVSDRSAAWQAVRANPALAGALGAPPTTDSRVPREAANRIADAVMEAVVAVSHGYTHLMERPPDD